MAGTFCFSNGLLLWPLLFPWFAPPAATTKSAAPAPAVPRVLYLAVGVVALIFYFFGYHPADRAAWGYALGHPVAAARYFLTWCAAPLRPGGPPDAGHLLLGAVIVVLFAAGVMAWWWDRRDGAARAALWPWAALGLFALGSGVLTAVGRTRAGVDTALSSRYTVNAAQALIALLGLGWTWVRWRAPASTSWRPVLVFTAALVLGVAGTLQGRAFRRGASEMPDVREAREKARAALAFINLIPDNPQFAAIYPDLPAGAPALHRCFHRLRDAGLVRVPLADPALADSLAQPAVTADPPGAPGGAFDICRPLARRPEMLLVQGWASDPTRPPHEQPAANVVLTWTVLDEGRPRGSAHPFTLVQPGAGGVRRPDVAAALGQPAMVAAGFEEAVFRPYLPPEVRTVRVAAWSVDARTGAARRLRGYVDVSRP